MDLKVDLLSLIAIPPEVDDHSVTTFADAIFMLGNEIVIRISNAISLLDSYQRMLHQAMIMPDGQEKLSWMQRALDNKNKLFQMKLDTSYEGRENYEDKEQQSMMVLWNMIIPDITGWKDIFG